MALALSRVDSSLPLRGKRTGFGGRERAAEARSLLASQLLWELHGSLVTPNQNGRSLCISIPEKGDQAQLVNSQKR